MIKERFMELAKQEGIDNERAEGIWRECPYDPEELSEERVLQAFEFAKTPAMTAIFEIIKRASMIFDAHIKAARN